MDPYITQKQNSSLPCPIRWLNGSEELEDVPRLSLTLNLDKFNPNYSENEIKEIKDSIDPTVPVYIGNDAKGRKYVVFQVIEKKTKRLKPEYLKTRVLPFIMYKNRDGDLRVCEVKIESKLKNMNYLIGSWGYARDNIRKERLRKVFQGKQAYNCDCSGHGYHYYLTSEENYKNYLEIISTPPKKVVHEDPEILSMEEIAKKWSNIQEWEENILALTYRPTARISLEIKRNEQLRLLCTEENLKNLMFHLLGVGENPRGIDEHTSLFTGIDKDKKFYFCIQYIFPNQKEPKNVFRDTITIENKGSSLSFTYEKSPNPFGSISSCKLLSQKFIRLRHIQMIQRLVQKGVSTPEDYDRITKACKKELL